MQNSDYDNNPTDMFKNTPQRRRLPVESKSNNEIEMGVRNTDSKMQ